MFYAVVETVLCGTVKRLHKLLPVVLLCMMAGLQGGCAAMKGVNVGASIPIGGVVGVGVNKTIGDGQSKTPQKQQKPPSSEPENQQEETETSEE